MSGGAYYIYEELLQVLQEYLKPYLHNVTIQIHDDLPKKKNAVLLLVPPVDGQWREDNHFKWLTENYHLVSLQLEYCKDVQGGVSVSVFYLLFNSNLF